jgi:hypothetical protein
MKNLQLMLHLQRLLDGELPDTGLDELEELGTDDLEGGETGDLDDLAPVLEELDEMNEERHEPLDDLDTDLDGMEALLEPDDLAMGAPGKRGAADDLARLEELIRPGDGRRAGRARAAASARGAAPGGRTRQNIRLQRLLRVLDDIDDSDPVEEDVRRLRRLVSSRLAAGRPGRQRDPLDPVILRRREQIREFLGAWRETLRAARRGDREAGGAPAARRDPEDEI